MTEKKYNKYIRKQKMRDIKFLLLFIFLLIISVICALSSAVLQAYIFKLVFNS